MTLFLFLLNTATHAAEIADISEEIGKIIGASEAPSLAAAVIVDGQIVAAGASGVRKKGSDKNVQLSDKYHIGSCTKSMTATLAAILVEEGKISWDSTIEEVFNDIEIHQDFRKVRLYQLLTNISGTPKDIYLSLWLKLWQAKGTLTEQRLQLVKGIVSEAPEYPPGTKFEYSNAGFSIAGAMLEKATGESYEILLKKKIFQPLGMSSAGFRAPAQNGFVDQPYGHIKRLFWVTSINPEPKGDNPSAIAPAGAVHCSVIDFAKYAQFHLGAIGNTLLSEESQKFLYTPTDIADYAMGWRVTERSWSKGQALVHTGSNTMFYSVIWLAPNRNFAAVAMSNYGEDEGFRKCDEAIGYLIRTYLEEIRK